MDHLFLLGQVTARAPKHRHRPPEQPKAVPNRHVSPTVREVGPDHVEGKRSARGVHGQRCVGDTSGHRAQGGQHLGEAASTDIAPQDIASAGMIFVDAGQILALGGVYLDIS